MLTAFSPADGSRIATIRVTGMSGIGALAWDRSREQMWACDSGSQWVWLITINGGTATAEQRFRPTGGCIDGLAYDGGDDSLFTSGDVESTIYHYTTDGTLLDSRYVGDSLGGCGSSGIAIGGGDLFLANNGCSAIYRVENRQDAVPQFYASFPRRIEDMECDDVTFRDEGRRPSGRRTPTTPTSMPLSSTSVTAASAVCPPAAKSSCTLPSGTPTSPGRGSGTPSRAPTAIC